MSLCQSFSGKKINLAVQDVDCQYGVAHITLASGANLCIFEKLAPFAESWDKAAPVDNIFQQSVYLKAIEETKPSNMEVRYALVKDSDGNVLAGLYYQLTHFAGDQNIQDPGQNAGNWLSAQMRKMVKGKFLTLGNLMLSGEHGIFFAKKLSDVQQASIIEECTIEMRKYLKAQGKGAAVVLVKDFCDRSIPLNNQMKENFSFHEFVVQPCMKLELRPHWKKFDDYLGDMHSKARTRLKRSVKKGTDLQFKELGTDELTYLKHRIHYLYMEVSRNAGFSTFTLPDFYFAKMKERMGDEFRVFGYFLNDELIGFFTTIRNGHELDAHFLGLEHKYNASHQLYLNMLLEMVKQGIELGYEHINFSRTALEIKSSIGAEPQHLRLFLKHYNGLLNYFVPFVFNKVSPVEEWTPRHPFKGQGGDEEE